MTEQRFELLVDGVPYAVTATPFAFNAETRYRVTYNGNDHIFAWDPSLSRLAPLDDESSEIPTNVEEAIAGKIYTRARV